RKIRPSQKKKKIPLIRHHNNPQNPNKSHHFTPPTRACARTALHFPCAFQLERKPPDLPPPFVFGLSSFVFRRSVSCFVFPRRRPCPLPVAPPRPSARSTKPFSTAPRSSTTSSKKRI